MPKQSGLTRIELLVVISIIAMVVAFILPVVSVWTTAKRHTRTHSLRGLHQSVVIYSQFNGFHLPGLDSSGNVIEDGPATGYSGPGSTVEARFWILLDQQFIPPEMLHWDDFKLPMKWTTGAVKPVMYQFAMLRIDSTNTDAGRMREWRDTANPNAVAISDQNIGSSGADADVRSVWSNGNRVWRGVMAWSDNRSSFVDSHRVESSVYDDMATADDSIFEDEPASLGSNALMKQ